jgi:hypothetical protein
MDTVSASLPRLRAAWTPRGTPTRIATSMLVRESLRVAGQRAPISCATGRWERYE